jgi:hypothetical protein
MHPPIIPCTHPKYGPARYGLATRVVPGQSIVLLGTVPAGHRYDPVTKGPTTESFPIRREFRIGDIAEHGSYNMVYLGTIQAITQKTVTIVDGDETHRLSLYAFAEKNWDFDAEAAAKRNAEWMD